MTPQQLKKALVSAGFEVFRTLGDEIVLADRVRENLILDSGVRLRAGEPYQVKIVMKAQKIDFPHDADEALFERVRALRAKESAALGFTEVSKTMNHVKDPSNPENTLDTFYEISFVQEASDFDAAVALVRTVLKIEKTVAS